MKLTAEGSKCTLSESVKTKKKFDYYDQKNGVNHTGLPVQN